MKIKQTVKKPNGIAAILSLFVPGLGQLIKGQIIKGIVFFVGIVISMPTIIIPLVLWIICIMDAYSG